MASLIPCTACRRHVRRHETECRFCGAQLNNSGALLREILIPRDTKRATLFALGITIAGQACGGMSEVAIHGAPPGSGAANGSGGSGAGNGMGGSGIGGNGNGNGNGNGDSDTQITPVYGAPVPPAAGGTGGTGMPDASPSEDAGGQDGGSDAAAADAGN
jgi:hypothetical protein